MDNFVDLAMKFIVPFVVSIPTAIIAVKLALRKFKSEKWWDKKLACYIGLSEALSVIINYADMVIDIKLDGVKHDEEELNNRKLMFNKSMLKLQTQVYSSVLFMDNTSHESLLRFYNKLFSMQTSSEDPKKLAELRENAEFCLNIINKEAKREYRSQM
ncbi:MULTISPECIES: hypothetical protein [unclassified Pseudoalteromonas]|uniref:hypothetical protein n=1 Tax=unclassified Pseudoalteromonas TaxID=194690 RepID=UPI0013FD226F|nr:MULTISPECIES: hypothetical protein [unclassified Pseudoalteromonas]MBB1298004.1 hypothetical protein [Pseudoalteromonas sp. SR41-7]MBB1344984.1 hypothetical protein [Pseudoalteromonas sp. SG45-2]